MSVGITSISRDPSRWYPNAPISNSSSPTEATAASVPLNGRYAKPVAGHRVRRRMAMCFNRALLVLWRAGTDPGLQDAVDEIRERIRLNRRARLRIDGHRLSLSKGERAG